MAALQSVDFPDDLQIPSLPTSLTEFLQAAGSPDYNIRALGQIIEQDPGLTLDLLKCVNSAALGSQHPVKTPTDALIRLGVSRARTHLLAAGMRSVVLAYQSKLLNCRNFWNESLRRALFAQRVAANMKADAELAYMGGLLQDFLLPALTNQYDHQYIQFLREGVPQGVSLVDWELNIFGWDHAMAGAFVAQKWNMPNDLLCAIMLHHRMDLVLESPQKETFNLFPVTLAALLPDQLNQVPDGVRRLIEADEAGGLIHLSELCTAVDRDLVQIAEKHDTPLLLSPLIEKTRRAMKSATA